MGGELIAWVVAVTLGFAVVGLGLRRDLGETTRRWLPRFGEGSEQAAATPPGMFDSGAGRRQLSPRQRRLGIWGYALFSLINAALAVLSAESRPLHAGTAVLFAVGAVVFWLRKPTQDDRR